MRAIKAVEQLENDDKYRELISAHTSLSMMFNLADDMISKKFSTKYVELIKNDLKLIKMEFKYFLEKKELLGDSE